MDTPTPLPEGRFKAEGRWWFRQDDKLLVYEGGEWVATTHRPVIAAPTAAQPEAAAAAPAPIRFGPLLGALAIGVSALLAWISFTGPESVSGFEVPIGSLIDPIGETSEKGFDIGWVLVVVAVVAAGLCLRPTMATARRVCGGLAIVVAGLFALQLMRALSEFGADAPELFDVLGLGVFLALGGGVVLVLDR